MRNGAQAAQQVLELFIAQQQRVAAAQEDVADFRMGGDVGDLLVVFGMKIITAGVAHQPGAGAVTAVAGTPVSDQKQHAVGITMHQTGHGRMGILAAGIAHLPRCGLGFLHAGNHLAADGAIFIGRVNQIEEIRGDTQRQLVVGEGGPGEFLGRERGQEPLQLLNGGDAMLELPAPVIPVGVGNVVPETATGRTELFQQLGLVRAGRFVGRR